MVIYIYATLRSQCDISDFHTLDTISLQIENMLPVEKRVYQLKPMHVCDTNMC